MDAADKIGPRRWDKGAAIGSRAGHILPERAELGLKCGVMLSRGLLCVVVGRGPLARPPAAPPRPGTRLCPRRQKTDASAPPPTGTGSGLSQVLVRHALREASWSFTAPSLSPAPARPALPDAQVLQPEPPALALTQRFSSWEFSPEESSPRGQASGGGECCRGGLGGRKPFT